MKAIIIIGFFIFIYFMPQLCWNADWHTIIEVATSEKTLVDELIEIFGAEAPRQTATKSLMICLGTLVGGILLIHFAFKKLK